MKQFLISVVIILLISGCGSANTAPEPEIPAFPESGVESFKEDESGDEEQPPEAADQRTYYRYEFVHAGWDENEAAFPAEWLEAANTEVCAKIEAESAKFCRGWIYDFDRDGRDEAIMLFLYSPDDSEWADWDKGFDHFVYVNADGGSQYLASGYDRKYTEVEYQMDIWLLKYRDFNHIVLRKDHPHSTTGMEKLIYKINDDKMEAIFMPWHLSIPYWNPEGVFLQKSDWTGMAPRLYFWDGERQAYSTVGAVEISVEEFFRVFEQDKAFLRYPDSMPRDMEDMGVDWPNFTPDKFEKAEVYGNRYYHLYLSKELCESYDYPLYPSVMTWLRHEDGRWELADGPRYGLRFEEDGSPEIREEDKVYDVDMDTAEKNAV